MSQPALQPLQSAPAGAPVSIDDLQPYLIFVLGGEMFALGIFAIKEIIEYSELTTLPMTPAHVRGVINLRGAAVPVLDLCVRFGKSASPITKRSCIVILEVDVSGERHAVGVLVDAVNAVLDISPAEIEPPPAFGTWLRTDFVQGMGKVNGRFVILLNIGEVLAAGELAAISAASETSAAQGV